MQPRMEVQGIHQPTVSDFVPNDGNGRNAKSGRVVRKLCHRRQAGDRTIQYGATQAFLLVV